MRKSNTSGLLSSSYLQICLGNFLLFISRYMLLPMLPVVMAGRLGVSLAFTGSIFVLLTAGMFLAGPFYSYLMDTYKRKYICLLSFAIMLLVNAACLFVQTPVEFMLLCLIHGISFGLATTTSITLAIDLTNPGKRSASNEVFGWTSRFGMMMGVAAGIAIFMYRGFDEVVYLSAAVGGVGILLINMLYVPFRAPIGSKLCTTDRFLLGRGWIPMLNMILIALIPSVLITLVPDTYKCVVLMGYSIPFFAVVGTGFFISAVFLKLLFKEDNFLGQIISGLVVMILATALLAFPVAELTTAPGAVLLGIGMGLVTPEFLLMFVKLSQHCQRGTANTMHLLSWETGISIGIAIACYTTAQIPESLPVLYRFCLAMAVLSLIFFLLVTYPYFKKKRFR